MPIYMDVHMVPGVKASGVAEAHRQDLVHQEEYACKCMTYWIDEQRESVFCLIEAPDKQAVEDMHRKAHGLIPNKIIEVESSLVESFLGRIYDPASAEIADDGLKLFSEPSFRILLLTKITDPVLLSDRLGKQQVAGLLGRQTEIIRDHILKFGGREVEHKGTGFIISFTSAVKAVSCALALQEAILPAGGRETSFRIGMHAGEPVAGSNKLFGDTMLVAEYLCAIAEGMQVAITNAVKELISNDHLLNRGLNVVSLAPDEELLLLSLFGKLEENWQDPEFYISDYGGQMAMSKSQLYRKTISLTSHSPNQLLKNFRLEKAKTLMNEKRYSISQITFESGFTSPSYFTKCFKNKYGLLPMAYLDLLH